MKENERFADTGAALYDLATHFVVHCPKCRGKALVNPTGVKTGQSGKNAHRLTCTACFHVEQEGHWYGASTAYVSVKCRVCHAPLQRSAEWDGKWKKLAMHCDACGDDCEYEAHISRHHYHEGLMTDPVFGLPLWLQERFRDELFWAYHYEHLELLRQYVGAKLRERGIEPRNTIRKNSAMLSRLPEYIKRAANREPLLKLMDELSLKA